MSTLLTYVLKLPYGDLPRWTIFFVYKLFLTPPILLLNFDEKGRIVLLVYL